MAACGNKGEISKENKMKVGLEDRMRQYEEPFKVFLPQRMPVIIRLDGRAFHALTRTCERPFSSGLAAALDYTAEQLLSEIQNARFAYIQSDEISFLLIDYNKFDSQQWFGGNIQKIVSVSASLAGISFSEYFGRAGAFDSRAFVIPERDVVNYFVWRQRDWERNSVQMLAQSHYSHKQLNGKNNSDMQEMILQKGANWNNLPTRWKRGRVASAAGIDVEIPIFSQNREYIEQFMTIEEE